MKNDDAPYGLNKSGKPKARFELRVTFRDRKTFTYRGDRSGRTKQAGWNLIGQSTMQIAELISIVLKHEDKIWNAKWYDNSKELKDGMVDLCLEIRGGRVLYVEKEFYWNMKEQNMDPYFIRKIEKEVSEEMKTFLLRQEKNKKK